MAQQALRGEDDERQRIFLEQRGLAAKQVKVLRGRRAVGDAHVDVGGELEKSLRPRAGVIGPLPFVAVRQEQDERRLLAPLARAPTARTRRASSCAPLMKSPYCASQITSRSGACTL